MAEEIEQDPFLNPREKPGTYLPMVKQIYIAKKDNTTAMTSYEVRGKPERVIMY